MMGCEVLAPLVTPAQILLWVGVVYLVGVGSITVLALLFVGKR